MRGESSVHLGLKTFEPGLEAVEPGLKTVDAAVDARQREDQHGHEGGSEESHSRNDDCAEEAEQRVLGDLVPQPWPRDTRLNNRDRGLGLRRCVRVRSVSHLWSYRVGGDY